MGCGGHVAPDERAPALASPPGGPLLQQRCRCRWECSCTPPLCLPPFTGVREAGSAQSWSLLWVCFGGCAHCCVAVLVRRMPRQMVGLSPQAGCVWVWWSRSAWPSQRPTRMYLGRRKARLRTGGSCTPGLTRPGSQHPIPHQHQATGCGFRPPMSSDPPRAATHRLAGSLYA